MTNDEVPQLVLKARHVKARAEASLRAKAQVPGHHDSPALKGRTCRVHRSFTEPFRPCRA